MCLQAADCIENGSFKGDEEKQVKDLRVSCLLNGAACSLKLKGFLETIGLCTEVNKLKKKEVDSCLMRFGGFLSCFSYEHKILEIFLSDML